MQALTPAGSPDRFFERVRTTGNRALLLDYDGTIAPFSVDWRRASPYPEVREALSRILAAGATRLAVVSGRPERDLETLLEMDPLPELWGSHGLEHRMTDGSLHRRPVAPGTRETTDEACSWILDHGWEQFLERKPFGLALHSRGAAPDEFERMKARVSERWTSALAAVGLERCAFDGGIEWRPPGHKGEVVEVVLSETGADAAVAYVGDDRTDEDAFSALSGRGLGVLARSEFRPTAADLWIRPPEELLQFLERWERAALSL